MAKCPGETADVIGKAKDRWTRVASRGTKRETTIDKWLVKLCESPHFTKNTTVRVLEALREFDRPKTKALAQRAAAGITIGFSRTLVI
jgi:hypothetical protein